MTGEEEGRLRSAGIAGPIVKLKWLTGLRLLLASSVLGSAFVLDLHEHLPFPTAPLYWLLGLTFALSLLYALMLRGKLYLSFQGIVQLAFDLLLVTLLVHFTGGLDSVFAFVYIFVIFTAANLLEWRGTIGTALLSAGLYATLVTAEWMGIIPPVEFMGGLASSRPIGYALYPVLIHSVAFLAVAILSSHLMDRLRQTGKELERRGIDLRNLQTLHQAIVANISSGLMTLDLTGHVISFNEAAQRITGYDFESLRDRPWPETPFASCPPFAEFFANPSTPPQPLLAEMNLQRRDGAIIPVGMACSPLRNGAGDPAGLVAIFQDLTDRKRVEERLRRADRLAALGQLAANIAHEIRNPLASISGSVEVLRDSLFPSGPDRELLDIILREAHRLKLITGQFLDFAKPRPLVCRPCRVRPLLDETLQLLDKSPDLRSEVSWSVVEQEPDLHVLGDADQLRQVTWNLCLNAVQSMPAGGALTVTLRRGSPPEGRHGSAPPGVDEWVEIAFQDTGQGMPPQELERIFDPFYTTRSSGTGLGLAIARKILESMGGHIEVESTRGVGTIFRVWLPQAPAAGSRQAAANDQIPMTNDQPRASVRP